jgi:hypothetical protein
MQNVTMRIDAATVQRIVENHVNESLAHGMHARVTTVGGYPAPTSMPNQPNLELTVTFDVVEMPVPKN